MIAFNILWINKKSTSLEIWTCGMGFNKTRFIVYRCQALFYICISIKIFQHYYKYLTLGRMLIYCMDEIWRLKYGDLVTWWDINILSGQYVLCYIIFIIYYSNMYNTNINSAKFYIMLNKLVNTEQHTTEHILWTMGHLRSQPISAS